MPTNNMKYTLDGFNDFINKVKKMSSDYDYVVVRGRRCFNIIARWLPELDFITFPALLSKYKELVNYYQENKCFPKILVIDDISWLYPCNGIAQDIELLGDILTRELLNRNVLKKSDDYPLTQDFCFSPSLDCDTPEPDNYRQVYSDLFYSISAYVFANSTYSSYFLPKTGAQCILPFNKLRDYSLQLGETIKRWDTANTDCTYSVKSQILHDVMLNQPNGRIGETNWIRQESICMGEPMILYTRLNGKNAINRIDTIRIFPKRISKFKELPFISSFSFFGILSQNASLQLIRSVRQELENAGLNKMAEILETSDNEEINHILLENQMQLIKCILSVAILIDFCYDVISEEELLNQLTFTGDFWKIMHNFGKEAALTEEFNAICKKNLRNRLKSIVLNIIDSNAEELIPLNPNEMLNSASNIEPINFDKIIDTMRMVLFQIEMQSEKIAGKEYLSEASGKYYLEKYASSESYGLEGTINLKKLFDLEEVKKFLTNSNDVYSLIFVIMNLIDNYQISLRLRPLTTPEGDTLVQNSIVTHELAGFYLPEKLSPLIEPLVVMELKTLYNPQDRVRIFRGFVKNCFGIESGIEHSDYPLKITDDPKRRMAEELSCYSHEENFELALKKLFDDVEEFYNSGKCFYGFYFHNLEAIANHRSSSTDMPQLRECLNYIIKIAWGNSTILPPTEAGFYLPKKLAPLIKPLVEIELKTLYNPQDRARIFRGFVKNCFGIESGIEHSDYPLEITDDVKKMMVEELSWYSNEENFELALKKLFDDVEKFYNSDRCFDKCFYDFYFRNKEFVNVHSSSKNMHQLREYLSYIIKLAWGDSIILPPSEAGPIKLKRIGENKG